MKPDVTKADATSADVTTKVKSSAIFFNSSFDVFNKRMQYCMHLRFVIHLMFQPVNRTVL